MIGPLITIAIGILVFYASYLNYYDRLVPQKRGLHHIRPGTIRATSFEAVRANIHFIRTGER